MELMNEIGNVPTRTSELPSLGAPDLAVLMTLHRADRLDLFEIALHSIETQTGVSGSIHAYLCCDGPLTDAQDEWLDQNRSRFHKILENKTNIGLARSLNRLIDELEGESFVFRMDGDDVSLPTRFATQLDHLRQHPELGIVGCQVFDIDDSGDVIGERMFPQDPEACDRAITSLMPILHPTFCMRREVLLDPRARYPNSYLTEDLAFLVTLLEMGVKAGNCPQFLFQWRIGPNFFDRRRSLKRGLSEFRWYARAIYHRHGIATLKYLKPTARLGLRLLPGGLQRWVYASGLRPKLIFDAGKKPQ